MKKIIPFTRTSLPAVIFSVLLIAAGVAGFFLKGGFNLGVDFQAGLIQEVQIAPPALSLVYTGRANAQITASRAAIDIVVSGEAVENAAYNFPFADYPTLGALADGFSKIEGLVAQFESANIKDVGNLSDVETVQLLQSANGNPDLGEVPYIMHYLPRSAPAIQIEDVRAAIASLGTASVQALGDPGERHFMIRLRENAGTDGAGATGAADSGGEVVKLLEERFGEDGVVITRSDYVGSRFSKQLTDQVGLLVVLTLVLILVYASIRFKPQFAIGAVLAISHDALVMVAFIAWSRMEFNTTTIAAILTILGYSINDTIVIFDRIRETRRVYPDDSFANILNRAISETLGRTIITTATTMLAVLSLFIFTTGSMKDFALALLVGMASGVYSTIFIASAFVNFYEERIKK
jgi:preprotein translocase subunit SecF